MGTLAASRRAVQETLKRNSLNPMDLLARITRVTNISPEEVVDPEEGWRDWNAFAIVTMRSVLSKTLEKSADVVAEQTQRHFDIP